ncbi:MAG: DsbA family protein [Burkholderiales bacterium]
MSTVLHYIHDPLCGWCYGAAPLVRAAREVVTVVAHAGGMMAGSNRQQVSSRLRSYVMPHDRRIAQLTGQHFGEAYFDGLLRDESAVFDSEPPIAAMLAADRAAGRGLDLLARLQVAHYQEGRRIAETAVLVDLAIEIGLDREAFASALSEASGEPTQAHIAASRALLARVGGNGFPTFALEQDGHFTAVDIGPHLGHADDWKDWLSRPVVALQPASSSGPAFACGPEGCRI